MITVDGGSLARAVDELMGGNADVDEVVRRHEAPRFWPRPLGAVLLVLVGASRPAHAQTLPDGFSIITLADELDNNATAFALLPDERILVANQTSGSVELIVNGVIREAPLVTVPNIRSSGEQGLLGIAVDPEFPDSNYIYVFHTRLDSLNRVSRYTVEGDLLDAGSSNLTVDENSQRTIIEFHDLYRFHNGGTLRFGIDDKLYVSHGDDARTDTVQTLTRPWGKIFRINRDGTAPPDNPVFDPEPDGMLDATFAMGLRNPFRFAIDPLTGELFIGDVGPEDIEELNISKGGENFGWPRYVAEEPYRPDVPLVTNDSTFPIHSYPHMNGMRAVIGLLTYRQQDYPNDSSFPDEYEGVHFFADFFAGPMLYARSDADGSWTVAEFASGIARPVDAALADDGGVYILEYGRRLRKIVYEPTAVGTQSDPTLPFDAVTLGQNYPNPFALNTRFSYSMAHASHVTVSVMNVIGRHVVTLEDGVAQSGAYTVVWDGRDGAGVPVPAGVYFYKVEAGGRSVLRRMLVAR